MAQKKQPNENSPIVEKKKAMDTFFNIAEVHFERINNLLDKGYDKVIIHGDGCLFAGRIGQKFGEKGETMEQGSDYHKEFNAGAPSINKNELVSRASYRATYERVRRPESVEEIIDDLYNNQAEELKAGASKGDNSPMSNTVSI